jgi:hypothetical protein
MSETARPDQRAGWKPLEVADFPAAIALLCEGFPERGADFWTHALARLQEFAGNHEAGTPLGLLMLDGNEPVGIALTPASLRRQRDGGTERLVNVSSWYVRPSYRWRAALMLRHLFADRNATFTDLTPTPEVQKMLPAFGFRPVNRGLVLRLLAVHALAPARGFSIRRLAGAWPALIEGPTPATLESHRRLGCEAFLVEGPRATGLVVVRRQRFRGLPGARLVYADSHALMRAAFGPLARALLGRGYLMLAEDAREPADAAGGLFRPHGIWFARNGNFTDRTDLLGSELCLFNL